jgi:hypothetical protein
VLDPEDQARLLRLIAAMEEGARIDIDTMRQMDAAELREWTDALGKPKA